MERHPDNHGPIQNFIAALYSAPFYRVAPHFGLRAGVTNLLVLCALLGFVTGVRVSAGAAEIFGHWRAGVLEGRIPTMTVAHGRLTVEGPQPWVGYGPGGLVAIVDTTGTYPGLPDSIAAGIFMGQKAGGYRTAPGMLQPIPYAADAEPTRLDAAGVAGFRTVVLPSLVVIGSAVFGFYVLVANALLVFLLAGPAHWLARRFTPEVRYREVLTLTLFVITPPALVFLTLGLVAPKFALSAWALYPGLTFMLLMGRIKRWLVPPTPAGPE